MPYQTLPDGSLEYVVSRWTKDDLPTWHELYYDFYVPGNYQYTPGHYQLLDPYWKIPRQLYLLATACNQINKILGEDGRMDEVVSYFSHFYNMRIDSIIFTLEPPDVMFLFGPVPIYSLPLPNGGKNIFALKDVDCRIDVSSMLKSPIQLKAALFTDDGVSQASTDLMGEMITYILQSVISYFRGSIGWKD